ncbi:conserved hypothetical protein [Leishmania mexicana MHOM/GT/2001/U1103]|uniref:Uncharacterized protein n=1 Tax=Leishmania mexicana (strain MHOM/GT/2001/U1103) TaxID=929439 RepID=E9AQE6_LEIMU|nr:conserved hypothetical protein [Leishmania mexicana MHOM/GT/2001/U1103]CBZ25165.1 conserved hypothetical protein [Leishmania mexicana MHOM/GT/2001/U1103]
MMRHFRVFSAAQTRCAVRTKMTGFNLFTQDMQKERKVLTTKSFKGGHENMRIMAKLWGELPLGQRAMYNTRALQRAALVVRDQERKNNTFNLLMKLFGRDKVLLTAGNETFTALMAKSTMHAMSHRDKNRLREKLNVDALCTRKERFNENVASTFKRFVSPNMLLFSSFTEMQRSVAPTRKSAFTAITKVLAVSNLTVSGEEYVMKCYSSLSPEVRNLFAPISDVEAPFFEMFCGDRCAGFDRKRFEIIRLFASFRGIEVDLGSNAVQDELFRSLINTDRSRDGIYFRVRRSLERLEKLRSSDCGLFIAKHLPQSVDVPPAAYGIHSSLDDVSVATLLAETRCGHSVYDDILTRAAMLRTKEKNKLLGVYKVARMITTDTVSNRQARVEKLKIKVDPQLRAAKPVLKLNAAPAPLRKKNRLSAQVPLKKLTTMAEPQRKQTVPIVTTAPSTKATPVASPNRNAPPAVKLQLVTKRAAGFSRTKTKGVPASCRTRVKVSAARKVAAAASKKVLEKVTSTSQATTITDEGDFFAEDVMADGEGDDIELDVADEFAGVTNAQVTAPTAPVKQKRKSAGLRAARSHLFAPESMLPATARSQKVIMAHTPTCRKAPRPVHTSPSSPFAPARRKVSFADNIRAQLASLL